MSSKKISIQLLIKRRLISSISLLFMLRDKLTNLLLRRSPEEF